MQACVSRFIKCEESLVLIKVYVLSESSFETKALGLHIWMESIHL